MRKRFFGREFLVLMVPVLLIGGWGWWVPKRSVVQGVGSSQGLEFRYLKPTTLQVFQGIDGGFELTMPHALHLNYKFNFDAPFLELEPESGGKPVRYRSWGRVFRVSGASQATDKADWLFRLRPIPAGKLSFGYKDLAAAAPFAAKTAVNPLLIAGKWELDRVEIKAPDLAAMPRLPAVALRSVRVLKARTISRSRSFGSRTVMVGEAIFALQSPDMDENTSVDFSHEFSAVKLGTSCRGGAGGNSPYHSTRETALTRVYQWEAEPNSGSELMKVGGRVSVDERWPLGLTIEPFRFKDLKDGQKLTFKTFLVPLPR